jgi:hypothetical protein
VAYCPCGVSSTSQKLYKEFLDNLFLRGENCLGRAVFAARCSVIARYPDDDSIYGPAVLWTLFGDPALRIKHRIGSGIQESEKPGARGYGLTVAPNPCDASVRLSLSYHLQTADCRLVTICDASGRQVCSQPFRTSSFTLPTSSFPPGVYFARCATGASFVSARLVVQH